MGGVEGRGDGLCVAGDAPWWTVEEFARLTRKTASAVRASIQRGELRACKLGSRRYFIRKADVNRMFEEAARG